MERIPQIGIVFLLTKKDSLDFDCDAITQVLHIIPTKASKAELSKGKVNSTSDISVWEKELSGLTLLPLSKSSYQILKHAYWSFEFSKIESWCLQDIMLQFERMFLGKEEKVCDLCKKYNLNAKLILKIYADSCSMPELTISNKSICFWATMGVDIDFDLYLD